MKILDSCDLGASELNKFQRLALTKELKRYYAENPLYGDINSAAIAFIGSSNYIAWASGLKARYCNFLCPNNFICKAVYDAPHYPQENVELPNILKALEIRNLGFIYEPSKKELQTEVGRNKWFLSQRKSFEISWESAEEDYIRNYLDDFERGFCVNSIPSIVERELRESNLKKVLI
jgi:hypothetical protein